MNRMSKNTLVMGPIMLNLWPELLATDASGLAPLIDILGLNVAIPWETPGAKVNCSRSSTLVRPLAEINKNKHFSYELSLDSSADRKSSPIVFSSLYRKGLY